MAWVRVEAVHSVRLGVGLLGGACLTVHNGATIETYTILQLHRVVKQTL